MSAALVLAAVAFHFLTLDTGGILPDNGEGLNSTFAPVVLAAMILYVACYATGIGNIPVRWMSLPRCANRKLT